MSDDLSKALDAKVARRVMGYGNRVKDPVRQHDQPVIDGAFPTAVPHYATDIASAMSCLCAARSLGLPEGAPPRRFEISSIGADRYLCVIHNPPRQYFGRGTSISEAVAWCALALADDLNVPPAEPKEPTP